MNDPVNPTFTFDAFISYSRQADQRLAKPLRRHLQQFAKPWLLSLRALRIFLDDSMPVGGTLPTRLSERLSKSRWVILLASPKAASSPWVNLEMQQWLAKTDALDRLIVVLTDGDIVWNTTEPVGFDLQKTTSLPAPLLDAYKSCPTYLDLREWRQWEQKKSLRLSNPHYEKALAAISGSLRNQEPDDLRNRDRRLRTQLISILSALTIAALLLALATSWFAWGEAVQAEAARQGQRRAALNELKKQDELVRRYVGNFSEASQRQDFPAALVWAVEALKTDGDKAEWRQIEGLHEHLPNWEQRRQFHALRVNSLLREYPPLRQNLFLGSPVKHVAFVRDSSQLLSIDDNGATVWDVATGRCVIDGMNLSKSPDVWGVSPQGTYLAMAAMNPFGAVEFRVWTLADGKLAASKGTSAGIPSEIRFSADEKQIALVSRRELASDVHVFALPLVAETNHWSPPLVIQGAAFHPDGKHLIWVGFAGRPALGADGEQPNECFTIADLESGRTASPQDHQGLLGFSALDVNLRGNLIALGHPRGQVSFWDFENQKSWPYTLQSSGEIAHLEFSGTRLLVQNTAQTGSTGLPVIGGEWSVWDLPAISSNVFGATRRAAAGLLQRTTIQHTAFSPNGELVVVCTDDGEATLWDIHLGRPKAPTLAHAGPIRHAAFSADSRQLATAGDDGQVRVWELPATADREPQEAVINAAVSPDGRTLLTFVPAADSGYVDTSSTTKVQIRDVALDKPGRIEWQLDRPVSHAAFSPSGELAAVASDSSAATFTALPDLSGFFIDDPSQLSELEGVVGKMLQPGESDSVVRDVVYVRRVNSTTAPIRLEHTGVVLCIGFSPDSTLLLAAGTSNSPLRGAVSIWDAATGKAFCPSWEIPIGPVDDFQLSQNGGRLCVRTQARMVYTWEIHRDTPARALGHISEVFDASSMSSDGKYVATATGREIMLRDAATFEPIGVTLEHDEPVRMLRFVASTTATTTNRSKQSELPRLLAAGEHVAKVWDLRTATPIGASVKEQEIVAAVISPNGKMFATINGADGSVHVWELESGLPLAPPFTDSRIPLSEVLFQNRRCEFRFLSEPDRLCLRTRYDLYDWSLESNEFEPSELALRSETLVCRIISDIEGRGVAHLDVSNSERHLNYLIASSNFGSKATAYLQRARKKAGDRKWSDAIRDVETSIRGGAPPLQAKRLLATCYDQRLQYDLSQPVWKWITERQPMDIDARSALANSLYMLGRGDEAVETLLDCWRNPELPIWLKSQADLQLSRFRGTVAAEKGEWQESRQSWHEFMESTDVKLLQADFAARFYISLSHLAEGDRDKFRAEARAISEAAATRQRPQDWYWAAWVGCVLPDTHSDWTSVVELAQAYAKTRRENWNGVLGAAMLRAHRWDEALELLEAEETESARVAQDEQVAYRGHPPAYNWLFLALGHAYKGNTSKAQAWLDKADKWVREQQNSPVILPWNRRVLIDTLRAEVREILQ